MRGINVSLLPVTAVIILGVSLLAQTSAQPLVDKAAEHPASPCVVAGRVVTASEGTPLQSARVALVPERPASRRHIYATTSDSEGRFLLKDVEQGRYEFFATRAGFVDQHYQAKGDESGATLSLKPGEKVSDVLFRMTVAAVITGRVTNDDGEAMVRVQVAVLRAPSEEEIEDEALPTSRKRELRAVSYVQTDDRGEYRIFGLKPGEYYIRVTDSLEPDQHGVVDEGYWVRQFLGSEYAAVYYPGVSQVSQAQVVSVKPGQEAQADVAMRRVKTVEVAGHVIGPNGPAKNAWVHMEEPQAEDYGFDRQDTTDEKGNFRLKGVPSGSYVIMVLQQPEGGHVYEARARQKVEVDGDNIDSLIIALGQGITFHGRVLVAGSGSPTLDRIVVNLQPTDEDEQLGTQGRVKKDGTFEITEVQDGNYAVQVWGIEDNWYVKSARLGADDILAEGLQLEKGASAGRLEVTLGSASAQLEGSVSDDDGAVIGARVRVAPDPETPYNRFRSHSTRTDQAGHFSLAGLAPGRYRVFARSPVSSEGSSYQSERKGVTLSENDHKTLSVKLIKPQD
jgi:protocatechuate 3,4-dioxygenase beta subunit